MSVRRKMLRGSVWLMLEKICSQGSAFIVFAIIARLIGPSEYGLIALCSIFASLAMNVINGLVDAVVSKRLKDDGALSSLFWAVMAVGVMISLMIYGISGPFAALMNAARLAPLLRVFAILPLLLAVASIPSVLILAEMDFRVYALRTLSASLMGGIVGIVLAYRGSGAFAIVYQQITYYLVVNIILWRSCKWRPRWTFERSGLRDNLRLGANQASSMLVGFVDQQAPRLIIGLLAGPTAVGQYAFAYRITGAVMDAFIQPLLMLVYPAFSQMHGDVADERRLMDQLVLLFGIVLLVITGVMAATAPLYVPLFFGRDWESSAGLLQVYLFSNIALTYSLLIRDFLRARRLTGSYVRVQAAVAVVNCIAAAVLAPRGIMAFVAGVLAVYSLAVIAYASMMKRQTGLRLWRSMGLLGPPLAATLCMAAALFEYMRSPLFPAADWARLATSVAVGIGVYGSALLLMQFERIKSLLRTVRTGWQ